MTHIHRSFVELFPVEADSKKEKQIALALLHFGAYWHHVSPWYYENYDLGDWRRVIRGRGSKETGSENQSVFRRFFDDFCQKNIALDDYIQTLQDCEISGGVDTENELELRPALLWYAEKLGTRFLDAGFYIARNGDTEERDKYFPKMGAIWTTKGSFGGYHGYQKLSDLITGDDSPPTPMVE